MLDKLFISVLEALAEVVVTKMQEIVQADIMVVAVEFPEVGVPEVVAVAPQRAQV